MTPLRQNLSAALLTLTLLLSACGSNGDTPTTATDSAAPTVALVDLNTSVTQAGTVTLKANASDDIAVKEVKFYVGDQLVGTASAEPYQVTYNWAANGSYVVRAVAQDTAGKTNEDRKTVTVALQSGPTVPTTPDTAKPAVNIAVPNKSVTEAGTLTFDVAASDNVGVTKLSGVLTYTDSRGVVTNTSKTFSSTAGGSVSVSVDSSVNGTYRLAVTATDAAGNTTETSETVLVSISTPLPNPTPVPVPTPNPNPNPNPNPSGDVTPPTVSVNVPADTITAAGSYSVSASATDNVGVVSLTGVLTRPNGSSQNLTFNPAGSAQNIAVTSADNGTLTLTVTASDAAGNRKVVTRTISVGISGTTPPTGDAVPPTVTVSGPAATVQAPGTYQFIVGASDNVGVTSLTGVLTRPNGSTQNVTLGNSGGVVNVPVTEADNGTFSLTVTGKDAAGNPATATAAFTVNIAPPDTTPPTISITAPSGTIRTPGFYTVTVSARDNVGVVSLTGVLTTPDGANRPMNLSPSGGSQSIYVTSQYNGTSTLVVTAKDAAGNTTTQTATVTVQIP